MKEILEIPTGEIIELNDKIFNSLFKYKLIYRSYIDGKERYYYYSINKQEINDFIDRMNINDFKDFIKNKLN